MMSNGSKDHERDFGIFLDVLWNATRYVGKEYFQLPVAEMKMPIFRERNYCYELYHWMRNSMPTDFGYQIGGEVDKIGHPIIEKYVGKVKPDFIVHVPDSMDDNLVVIEVKPIIGSKRGIIKDIKNLSRFLTPEIKYFRAVYLIYGDDSKSMDAIVELIQKNLGTIPKESFYLVWHRQSGNPAEIIWVNQ